MLIGLFFNCFALYQNIALIGHVCNLDKCGFKLGQTTNGSCGISPAETRHNKSYKSSCNFLTVLECISGSGAILEPLLIYRVSILWRVGFQAVSRAMLWFRRRPRHLSTLRSSSSGFSATFRNCQMISGRFECSTSINCMCQKNFNTVHLQRSFQFIYHRTCQTYFNLLIVRALGLQSNLIDAK